MAFLLDCWYVAGWSDEITQQPLARTFCDEPVVLFRGASGAVVALEDRCCHRNLPLSQGKVEGDCIACGYHGMVYDARGICIRIPGQDIIPKAACVRRFPVQEQDGAVWIWLGDPMRAEGTRPPAYPFHSDPRWAHKASRYLVQGHHELINDNLIDLSHVGYVHGKTIGGPPQAHSGAHLEVQRQSEGVMVRRWMPDSVPPPTYQRTYGFAERIDRWMEIGFVPGLIQIYIGANDAGKGVDQDGHMDPLGIRIFNGITPETAHSTHYFWSAAHNFKVGDAAVTQSFFNEIAATFEEDKVVIEAQQDRFERFPERPDVALQSDAGGVHARRVMAEAIKRQGALVV
jgi:phenylpropionate dioxygenase-like ring-hydroxylating dioxygenase large terminal subunit